MDFHNYLILLRRRWKEVIIITALTIISSLGFNYFYNKAGFQTIIFLNIGAKETTTSSIYENVQAADQFTETVQGWFKNPSFIERIKQINNPQSEISVHKQEKQNILVNYQTETMKSGYDTSEAIKNELTKELVEYNTRTNNHFELALYSIDVKPKTNYTILFVLIAILVGFLLASGLSYLYEYSFHLASYDQQIIHILQKNYLEKISHLKTKKLDFLSAFLKKIPHQKIVLAGMNIKTEALLQNLHKLIPEKNFRTFQLPEQSDQLNELNSNEHLVLVCALGKSNIEDIQKLKMLLPQTFDLIIAQA